MAVLDSHRKASSAMQVSNSRGSHSSSVLVANQPRGYLFPAYHEYIVRVEITGLILLIVAMLFLLIVKMVRGEWDGKSLAFIIPA